MGFLIWIVLLAAVVVQILVAVQMFKNAGVVHGILGLICGLYSFIWGWMNSGKLGIKNLMFIWTGLIVLYAILVVTVGVPSYSVPTAPVTP